MSVAAHEASTGGASSHGRRPLDGVLNPKSVAVVGVTATPGTVPYDIFYNILASGYPGTVYPVAPGKRSICAVPAYRYVIDIEDPVDLAVIVFPAERRRPGPGAVRRRRGSRRRSSSRPASARSGRKGREREQRHQGHLRRVRHRPDRAELPGRDQHRSAACG